MLIIDWLNVVNMIIIITFIKYMIINLCVIINV